MILTLAGVILPSVLITLAVRRWIAPVSWKLAFGLVALAVLFIWRGVFTETVPLPLDEVMRGYPYRGLFPVDRAQNYLTNDTVKQILPWMETVRDELFRGRLPLWNRHLFSGYPLLGNGQSAPFSPFFLATIFVPLPKQMVAMAGVKLFVALLFGVLLLRREGVSTAAGVLGSAIYAFAVFNNAFLYYPMTAVTLLLPAAAFAALQLLHERTRAAFVLVVLVIASLLAGGHPESVVHVALAVVLLVGLEFVAQSRRGDRGAPTAFLRVTAAAILGLLLSAPAWLPVLEQARISVRVESLGSIDAAPRFPATILWAMLNPDGFGNPAHGNWNWITSYTHVASTYIGLLPLALVACAFGPSATRRDRLLLLLAFLLFLVSMRWTPLSSLFYAAPPLSWVAHDRLRFVVAFLTGILAARAIHRWSRSDQLIAGAMSIALVSLSLYVFAKQFGKTLTWISLIGIVSIAAFWIAALVTRRRAAAVACAVVMLELFVFTYDYNAPSPVRYYAPKLPVIDVLRTHSAHVREPFRILGLDWTFLPNAAAQYGFEDVRGSDPMAWSDYSRFLRTAAVPDPWIEDVKRIADPEHEIIDFLNVRYLLTDPNANLGGKWTRIYSGADGELYENTRFLPRFFAPALLRRFNGERFEQELGRGFAQSPLVRGDVADAVATNPQGVTIAVRRWNGIEYRLGVQAPGPAIIASSHPAMPGWDVRINGKPVPPLRINGAFLGFRVPQGDSSVQIKYRPRSVRASIAITLLALMILGVALRKMAPAPASLTQQ